MPALSASTGTPAFLKSIIIVRRACICLYLSEQKKVKVKCRTSDWCIGRGEGPRQPRVACRSVPLFSHHKEAFTAGRKEKEAIRTGMTAACMCHNSGVPLNVKHTCGLAGVYLQDNASQITRRKSKENQLNTPSVRNDMGLFRDNDAHLQPAPTSCPQKLSRSRSLTHTSKHSAHPPTTPLCVVLFWALRTTPASPQLMVFLIRGSNPFKGEPFHNFLNF